MSIIDTAINRYSVKSFDSTKTISTEVFEKNKAAIKI